MEQELQNSKTVEIEEGKFAILYDNGRVIVKKKNNKASTIKTKYDYFVGTKEEVDAKIKELGLIDLLEPPKEFKK